MKAPFAPLSSAPLALEARDLVDRFPIPGQSAPVPCDASRPSPSPAALGARTTIERIELKYWLTERLAEKVLAFAQPYLTRDPHAADRAAQRNTTLYLDSQGYHFYENHVTLCPDRSKLRIRVYGQPLGGTAFFEVKRKLKTITVKSRCALPIGLVEPVLQRRALPRPVPDLDRAVFADFVFRMSLHRARAKLYVGCFREAFESRLPGEDVRLTIDRELVYQPARGDRFEPDERRWLSLRDGDDPRPAFGSRRAMLELKFAGRAPRWMCELVRAFDLRREAFSKYTTAVQQLRGRA